ncbi:MAG: TrkH family potassium uptake protein [Firmicutes bacterium]|nr:TrkH family potassium uptake protein [Bacillota bacterium]
MNERNVRAVLGMLLQYVGAVLLLPLAVALFYREPDWWCFASAALLSALSGTVLRGRRRVTALRRRDAFAIVTLSWLALTLIGAVPFLLSGSVASIADGIFEAAAGATTTGATVFPDVERLSHGLQFWRALLQWLGGMGIVVLSLALLPQLAVGGMELYKAEAPTPLPERLRPRLADTAIMLWRIYLTLTAVLALLLLLAGMGAFDALVHALVTIPTGGFSNKARSIAAFDSPAIEGILIVFMFLAGSNFSLLHRAWSERRLGAITENAEFRAYAAVLALASLGIAWSLWRAGVYGAGDALRHGVFQAVSIVTTTGFASTDYSLWPSFASSIVFALMFVGASAGSTSGGVKVMRHLVILKHGVRELRRLVHPRSVLPLRIGSQTIAENVIAGVLGFLALYIMLFGVGTLLLAAHGIDLRTSASSAAAALGNVGPALGATGPMGHFGWLPASAKLVLTALMIVGRLEIYTVLVLVLPGAWTGARRAPGRPSRAGAAPRPQAVEGRDSVKD